MAQDGGTTYPLPDSGWAQEISLDLDMVSAVCPRCHILLVEANDNSLVNLGAAVNEAAALGANAISNSYGGREFCSRFGCETTYDGLYYNHPGVAVTASTGDSGYGVQYPAASPDVTAVGGTALTLSGAGTTSAHYLSETAGSGAGSGCSAVETRPGLAVVEPQHQFGVRAACRRRRFCRRRPQHGRRRLRHLRVDSVYALAGNAASVTYGSYPYLHGSSASLHDVTSGSNGTCGTLLCNATTGWDGPTGMGSPNGAIAF